MLTHAGQGSSVLCVPTHLILKASLGSVPCQHLDFSVVQPQHTEGVACQATLGSDGTETGTQRSGFSPHPQPLCSVTSLEMTCLERGEERILISCMNIKNFSSFWKKTHTELHVIKLKEQKD